MNTTPTMRGHVPYAALPTYRNLGSPKREGVPIVLAVHRRGYGAGGESGGWGGQAPFRVSCGFVDE